MYQNVKICYKQNAHKVCLIKIGGNVCFKRNGDKSL